MNVTLSKLLQQLFNQEPPTQETLPRPEIEETIRRNAENRGRVMLMEQMARARGWPIPSSDDLFGEVDEGDEPSGAGRTYRMVGI